MTQRIRMALAAAVVAMTVSYSVTAVFGNENRGQRQRFEMIDLGTLGGTFTQPVDINDRGDITGYSGDMDDTPRPFLWTHGQMIDLRSPNMREGYGLGINAHGQVLGFFARVTNGESAGFVWHDGTFTELSTLGGYTLPSPYPHAINDRGQVVADSATADGVSHAVVWKDGRLTELGMLPGGTYSSPSIINNRGQIAGVGDTGSNDPHGFLWNRGAMIDLGTLGGPRGEVRALNDSGQVIGTRVTTAGEDRAFLWENGTMIDLWTLAGNSHAVAINRLGQVLVNVQNPDNSFRAFLWENGSTTDLGTLPGNTSSGGSALNDRGQVVGYSTTTNGLSSARAFLWESGSMTALPGTGPSYASKVNARGEIVGWTYNGLDEQRGVLWTHRGFRQDGDR